ncbi:MAG: carbohydrate porin [Deltaproteobacteria bacterium]|nr:carbohydrate porin [Deltaproteobacteria bacterium]
MKRFFLLAAAALMLASAPALADERPDADKASSSGELRQLRERIEKLEQQMSEKEVLNELGHKLHPIHSIYGLRISGGLTTTAQGSTHAKTGPQRGAAALSADLAFESHVGENGRAAAVFDVQMGAGMRNLPPFATQPNANPTGPNNDLESFNNDNVHLAQIYYEHNVNKKLTFTVGKLDPTAYFDTNAYANTERSQFLANLFVNNPAIEFGGTADFYGPGIRATCKPNDSLGITVGAFEGKGNFNDTFNSPFFMAEVDLKLNPAGKEGKYRFYYWNRQGRPDELSAANPADARLSRAANQGAGISFDQSISSLLGVWLRAGTQREKVAQFGRFFGGGLNFSGPFASRPNDNAGFGYGADFIGKDYKEFKAGSSADFKPAAEHYLEAYYNIAIDGAKDNTGFYVTPDVQYVINPGGDREQNKLFIYGMRLQAYF